MSDKTDKTSASAEAKRKKMAHPDWHKHSGWPPATPAADVDEPRRKKSKAAVEPIEPEADGNGN